MAVSGSAELASFARRISTIVDPAAVRRIVAKAGMAGKESALDAASKSLGGDRAFSGMARKVRLSAGYDAVGAGQVAVNFRPAGLWKLAESGRRGSKPIMPRKAQALMTPHGPRARSTSTPSRGLNTYTDAVADARRTVPAAAAKQFSAEVSRAMRG